MAVLKTHHLHTRRFGTRIAYFARGQRMLKISTVEMRNQRRLVLEGKLIWPWTTELRRACEHAWKNLQGRELIVELKNLTVISQQGEYLLAALMNEGIKVRSSGVFTKRVVRQLVRQARAQFPEPTSGEHT